MGSITESMVKDIYLNAIKVYSNSLTMQSAIDELERNHSMNRGSAKDYLLNYRCLLDGIKYKRTMNEYATKYFIYHILKDRGLQSLKNALSAVQQHVDYYDSLGHGNLKSIRAILENYYRILSNKEHLNYEDRILNNSIFMGDIL